MKKVISLIIVATMLFAMMTVSFTALSVSDEGVISVNEMLEANGLEPGDKDTTQRIYFQMPNGNRGEAVDHDVSIHKTEVDPETGEPIGEGWDEVVIPAGGKAPSWYNEFNEVDGKNYAGVYWWGGTGACDSWVGYRAEIEDYDQGIYYVDLPLDVVMMIWNAGVDGGTDPNAPIYSKAAQTVDFNTEGCDESVYTTLPYGSPVYDESYDGCIFVVDPNAVSINAYSGQTTAGVNAYVYYGNGCYGSEMNNSTEYGVTDGWSDDMQEAPVPGYKLGDADYNEAVESIDAVWVMRYDAMMDIGAVIDTIIYADVDFSGEIDIVDAAFIQRYLSDMNVKYPIGTVIPFAS